MPQISNLSRNQYKKIVVLHNEFHDLGTPLQRDDVNGKFTPTPYSPGATDSTASVQSPTGKVPMRVSCDGHLHPSGYHQKGPTLLKMIQMANENNVKNFVAMRIPTNVISLQSDRRYMDMATSCGETYYLEPSMFNNDDTLSREKILEMKKKVELYVNSEVDWVQAAEYNKLTDDQKERIDLSITGLHLGDPRAHFSLFQKIADNDVPFSLVGEVTLAKEIVMHLLPHESQAHLKSHIKPFCTLIEMVGLTGMPMTLHCDVDTAIPEDIRPGHPSNLNGMMRLLGDGQVEDTTIIWAHFGGISRFGPVPEKHYDNIDSMLHRFPNLMIDLSWSRIASKLDPDKVAAVINNHPERFIMGSDALAPHDAQVLGQTYAIYDAPDGLFKKLSEDVLQKILVTNYERVIRGGREHCKKFKQHILPGMTDLLSNPAADNLRPKELRRWMLAEYEEKDPDYFLELSKEITNRDLARKDAKGYVNEKGELLTSSSEGAQSPVSTASQLNRQLSSLDIPSRTATASLASRSDRRHRQHHHGHEQDARPARHQEPRASSIGRGQIRSKGRNWVP
ncbi:MAG: amidohydrolase family protein [Oxalobacteraceae bacterium]|nr:amidohydrolase family protein [Oxalobacteraceae bacterium]